MTSLFCKWRGHRWVSVASYAPKAYYCTRCGESGTWVR
jgi:hypothetical protein